jgi:hypothetical protein
VRVSLSLCSLRQCLLAPQVVIDGPYAALLVSVAVIVGLATSLDSRVNLVDGASACLLNYSLTGRVVGRIYM